MHIISGVQDGLEILGHRYYKGLYQLHKYLLGFGTRGRQVGLRIDSVTWLLIHSRKSPESDQISKRFVCLETSLLKISLLTPIASTPTFNSKR